MCVLCCVCVCVLLCVLCCVCNFFILHTSQEVYFHFHCFHLHLPLPLKHRNRKMKPSCDGVMLRFCWSVEKEVEKFNENTEIPRSRWGHLCHEPLSHFYSKWFTTCNQHLHALVHTSEMLVQWVVELSTTTTLNHTEVILCTLNYWWKVHFKYDLRIT